MAQLVPTTKTSYSIPEMIKGFVEGWKFQFNEIPKKQSIAIIYAQWYIETGAGKSCWNNNIGNVKYIPSKNPADDENVQYMMLSSVWEIINGKKIIFNPPDKQTWFRAFPTLIEGVAFHLDILKNKKFKSVWVAVESGNPIDFAHLLKVNKYYTAPEEDYIKAISLYFNQFMKMDIFEKVVKGLNNQSVSEIEQPKPEKTSFFNTITKFISKLKE